MCRHYNNAYFARVGGVEVSEMNRLELEFLFALRFCLNVTPDDFASYCAALEDQMTAPTLPLSPRPLIMVSSEGDESSRQEQEQKGVVADMTTFAVARVAVAEITQ
jgi:hypothetical protein